MICDHPADMFVSAFDVFTCIYYNSVASCAHYDNDNLYYIYNHV